MLFKRMVVLANSNKKSERCVAGREIGQENSLKLGGWLRPVSGVSQGELGPWHMRVDDGKPIAVLDILDVPLTQYARDAVHPEDWIIDMDRPWARVGVFPRDMLAMLEEKPDALWFDPSERTDRATAAFLLQQPRYQSLYWVRPQNVRIEQSCEPDRYGHGEPRQKARVRFNYQQKGYLLNLTDPLFMARHCRTYPPPGLPPATFRPPCGDRCCFCVSLTPDFHGYHYKVVATILDLR